MPAEGGNAEGGVCGGRGQQGKSLGRAEHVKGVPDRGSSLRRAELAERSARRGRGHKGRGLWREGPEEGGTYGAKSMKRKNPAGAWPAEGGACGERAQQGRSGA